MLEEVLPRDFETRLAEDLSCFMLVVVRLLRMMQGAEGKDTGEKKNREW